MIDLRQSLENITNEWRVLDDQWKETCRYWNDPVQRRFDHEFWQEFEKLVPAYLRKLEETSNLIAKAYRELNL